MDDVNIAVIDAELINENNRIFDEWTEEELEEFVNIPDPFERVRRTGYENA